MRSWNRSQFWRSALEYSLSQCLIVLFLLVIASKHNWIADAIQIPTERKIRSDARTNDFFIIWIWCAIDCVAIGWFDAYGHYQMEFIRIRLGIHGSTTVRTDQSTKSIPINLSDLQKRYIRFQLLNFGMAKSEWRTQEKQRHECRKKKLN